MNIHLVQNSLNANPSPKNRIMRGPGVHLITYYQFTKHKLSLVLNSLHLSSLATKPKIFANVRKQILGEQKYLFVLQIKEKGKKQVTH